jgi:hypothetical protein
MSEDEEFEVFDVTTHTFTYYYSGNNGLKNLEATCFRVNCLSFENKEDMNEYLNGEALYEPDREGLEEVEFIDGKKSSENNGFFTPSPELGIEIQDAFKNYEYEQGEGNWDNSEPFEDWDDAEEYREKLIQEFLN